VLLIALLTWVLLSLPIAIVVGAALKTASPAPGRPRRVTFGPQPEVIPLLVSALRPGPIVIDPRRRA
jgi:hypothetical protein